MILLSIVGSMHELQINPHISTPQHHFLVIYPWIPGAAGSYQISHAEQQRGISPFELTSQLKSDYNRHR